MVVHGESGGPGSPGQPGGQISSTNSGLTIIGGFAPGGPQTNSFGAPIVSLGGDGGLGGESGFVDNGKITGGNGGTGGAGGDLTVNFARHFRARSEHRSGNVWARHEFVRRPGRRRRTKRYQRNLRKGRGQWGRGRRRWLGDARRQWCHRSVVKRCGGAVDRGGWRRWRRFITNTFRPYQGGDGGNGGTGGAVSLQWLSGTVQTTGFGLRATAVGGAGGNGGIAGMRLFS